MASKREKVLLEVKSRIVTLQALRADFAGDAMEEIYADGIKFYTKIAEALEESTHPDDSRWIDKHTDKTWSKGL